MDLASIDLPHLLRMMPVWLGACVFSTTCHEAAHAFIGVRGGDRTAEEFATLDPTPHIRRSPMGMIVIPIVSFFLVGGGWMIGWASVPYDPSWALRHPKKAAKMAAAGPLTNLLLAILALLGLYLGVEFAGWQFLRYPSFDALVIDAEGARSIGPLALSVLFSVNLLLGLFNLLPVPPLDGHASVPLLLSDRLTRRWFRLFEDRNASMFGMLIAWAIFSRLAYPIFDGVTALIVTALV